MFIFTMSWCHLARWRFGFFLNAPGSNNCGNCPPIPNQKPPTNNCIPTFTWAIPCLQKPPPPSPYEHGSRTTFNQAKLNLEGSHWLNHAPPRFCPKGLINPAWHPAVAPPSAAGLPNARAGAWRHHRCRWAPVGHRWGGILFIQAWCAKNSLQMGGCYPKYFQTSWDEPFLQ